MAIKSTVRLVPRIEGETPEQYASRCEAEKARREEALRKQQGVYRVIVSGPGGAFQVYATSDPQADEFFRRRLPGMLATALTETAVWAPDGVSRRSVGLRVLSVAEGVCGIAAGDHFPKLTDLGRALRVGNPHAYAYQARNAGKRTITIKGVTCCPAADYDELVGNRVD